MASRTILAADLFAGAGGTSTGLYHAASALGWAVRLLAINHWPAAVATHQANHPSAEHRCVAVDSVDPRQAVPGGRLDILVASPECTHFSRARGGRPRSDQSRASVWQVLHWAQLLKIESILIENVREFVEWGPLDEAGAPIQRLKGKTYLAFLDALRSLDYTVEARVLNCADYGDPTTRERLFILARRGEQPIRWPEPTHRRRTERDLLGDQRPGWRSAREIIDWSVPGESIFNRRRPLSPNTLKRIEAGLRRYSGLPFVLGQQSCAAPRAVSEPLPTVAAAGAVALIEPFLVQYHGSSYEGGERTSSVNAPLPTVATSNQFGLAEPFLVVLNGTREDQLQHSTRSVDEPAPTLVGSPHVYLAQPFIIKYNGTGQTHSVDEPLDTVTGKDRFGLVVSLTDGRQALLDIRFRMLQPHELAAAMSFPADYSFTGTREQRVKQIGNAVPVRTAEALCKALLTADKS